MRLTFVFGFLLALAISTSIEAADSPQPATPDPARQLREYRDFAMGHDGNPAHGRELFNNEQRLGCTKCHSVDGSASRAGPDLLTIGDSYPRRELVRSVLEPSATIAVGYGTTILETKSDETYSGILKQSTANEINSWARTANLSASQPPTSKNNAAARLADARRLARRFVARGIHRSHRLSRHPQGAALGRCQFRGMPLDIPELAKPIAVRPFFSEDLRFPHSFVQKPGDVRFRSGLVRSIARQQQRFYRRPSNRQNLASGKGRHKCHQNFVRRHLLAKFSTNVGQTGCSDWRSIRSFVRTANTI